MLIIHADDATGDDGGAWARDTWDEGEGLGETNDKSTRTREGLYGFDLAEVGEMVGKNHQDADNTHSDSYGVKAREEGLTLYEVREQKTDEASRNTSKQELDDHVVIVMFENISNDMGKLMTIVDEESKKSAEID